MAMRNANVAIMRLVVRICPHSMLFDFMVSTKKKVNRRRRRPVSVLLSHHRCLVTLSLVIVDPASCCVSPMTMNNQSVVVRRLVATSLWATWHLGCVCDYGNRREIA